jgi:CYTH domain-containing protein
MNRDPERIVRVRTVAEKGFLTVKGVTRGCTRLEYEYEIPAQEALTMLTDLCLQPLIEKKRHTIEFAGLEWEVDEFIGENRGLIVAEVELRLEGQTFEKPAWIGSEVTGDPRYYNSNLVRNPYCHWKRT